MIDGNIWEGLGNILKGSILRERIQVKEGINRSHPNVGSKARLFSLVAR
jgi:hypothetical protein